MPKVKDCNLISALSLFAFHAKQMADNCPERTLTVKHSNPSSSFQVFFWLWSFASWNFKLFCGVWAKFQMHMIHMKCWHARLKQQVFWLLSWATAPTISCANRSLIFTSFLQQQRARMCGGAGLAHNAMPTGPQRSPILVSSPWNVRFLTRTPPSTKVKGEKTEPMGIEQSTKEREWKSVFKMTSVSACFYS